MNDYARYLFTISFRMERDDFVALSKVMTRQKPAHVILELTLYFGTLLGIAALVGGPQNLLDTLSRLITAPLFVLYLPLILLGPALLLLTPQITGLIAALLYSRNAMADRDVVMHLTAEGIESGATDLYSSVGWGAVIRLVETRTHLFMLISRREALFVPRRAVPNEDSYNNLKGFIRARTGLSTFNA